MKITKEEIEAHNAEMSDNYNLEDVKVNPNRFANTIVLSLMAKTGAS